MSVGWSLDFCLTCDKQTDEGLYCSNACRSADRERGKSPIVKASDDHPLSSSTDSSSSSAPARISVFALPPAYDFRSSKADGTNTAPATPIPIPQSPGRTAYTPRGQHHPQLELEMSTQQCFTFDHTFPSTSPKTPSSSRPTSANLSKATRDELRRYDDAFDRSRTRRQRKSLR